MPVHIHPQVKISGIKAADRSKAKESLSLIAQKNQKINKAFIYLNFEIILYEQQF